MQKETKAMPAGVRIGESVFDIVYLLFDLAAGFIFFTRAAGRPLFILYGVLAWVLGGGDAFHLIPRVQMHLHGRNEKTDFRLGLGKAVTSVTMTVFYILLLYIWKKLFPEINAPAAIPVLIWATALLRIVVCFFPQNNWFAPEGNQRWSLYRNIPFAITGLLVIVLFALSGNTGGYGMWRMCIAIALSFAFYFPVTLLVGRKPAIGALMMPKTLMYVWIICMGLSLL